MFFSCTLPTAPACAGRCALKYKLAKVEGTWKDPKMQKMPEPILDATNCTSGWKVLVSK